MEPFCPKNDLSTHCAKDKIRFLLLTRNFIASMDQLREEIKQEDVAHIKKKMSEDGYNLSRGYGGKFGVEADRMDKSAVGHDYQVGLEYKLLSYNISLI